jgi:hypothetical protein
MIPFQLHRYIPLVRRPFYQRDLAMAERDALSSERNALAEKLSREANAVSRRLFGEQPNGHFPPMPFGRTQGESAGDDLDLVSRISKAYRLASKEVGHAPSDMWNDIFLKMKRDVHDALMSDDLGSLQQMLRDPGRTDLFYGFDGLARSLLRPLTEVADHSKDIYHDLVSMAEALGVRRVWAPESGAAVAALPEVGALLDALDDKLGTKLNFPNPFPKEIGLVTAHGIASCRAVQAIFQAHRIIALSDRSARVVEIGAGLGRTAFYAHRFGLHDYTIIDLPLTNVAQSYFLGRVLGGGAISLFGEDRPGIRILPSAAFMKEGDRYDLALNVDSLTEMDIETARDYCREIKARCGAFLSINHEHNRFTVSDVCAELGMKAFSRSPYWMRAGYVDEVFWLRSYDGT